MFLTRLRVVLNVAGLACMGLALASFVVFLEPNGKGVPLSVGLVAAGILLRVAAYVVWAIETSRERSDRRDEP